MSDTPLVSIVIPTYDRPELLGLALGSALAQTYEHLDIYIADDGTNDETEAVVREIAGTDARVRYERNTENLGNLHNGIHVLRQGHGEYLKMLLDDDLLAPTHVETLLAPLVDDPTIALAFSKRTVIDGEGVAQPDPPGMGPLADAPTRIPGEQLINLCCSTLMNLIGEMTTVLMPARMLDTRAPFRFGGAAPTGMLADLTSSLSVLSRGDAWYTPEALSSFRRHAGQVSDRPEVHLDSLSDWAAIHERLHLAVQVPSPQERMKTIARLIGALSGRLAATPELPQGSRAQNALERASRHLGALREHARLVDVPRASIVLVASGAAPELFAQLQAIIDATPEDAFEVVIVTVAVEPQVQALLDGLGGDVTIVESPGLASAWGIGRAAAQHSHVAFLAPDAVPQRGWLGALFDGFTPVDGLDPVDAVASADGGRALLMETVPTSATNIGDDPWAFGGVVHAQVSCHVDAVGSEA